MSSRKAILWDFEGTLARRHGGWARVVAEILTEYQPDHPVTAEYVHPFFYGRWPWNAPDLPHPHITTPEAWWLDVEDRVLITGYMKMGYLIAQAQYLARLTRTRYIDAQGWSVY